jgi:hypothetical protein
MNSPAWGFGRGSCLPLGWAAARPFLHASPCMHTCMPADSMPASSMLAGGWCMQRMRARLAEPCS